MVHAHGKMPFHQRLFKASALLFDGSVHSFEMYRRIDGAHTAETDVPFCQRRLPEIIARIGELVPQENPIFPYLIREEQSVLRLTDLVTQRQFHRTALYHDVFKDVELEFQMVIPTSTETHAGGLTINRGTRDYSDEDMATAVIFARHIALAFEADRLIRGAMPIVEEGKNLDFSGLRRRGLSRRECEVLWWMSQGKRDREIAVILGIGLRTANQHALSIFRKLNVETRVAAVSFVHKLAGPL